MISVRQSLVDVAKGDLPGHPFRGNQCVDEDWQPQPGDPCGTGGENVLENIDSEFAEDEYQQGTYMLDEDMLTANFNRETIERLRSLMAEQGVSSVSELEPIIFTDVEVMDDADETSATDLGLSGAGQESPDGWVFGSYEWDTARSAARRVVELREELKGGQRSEIPMGSSEASWFRQEYDDKLANEGYINSHGLDTDHMDFRTEVDMMFDRRQKMPRNAVVYRGSSENESVGSGSVFENLLALDPKSVKVGDVRETDFFMSTATKYESAARYAYDWQDDGKNDLSGGEILNRHLDRGELVRGIQVAGQYEAEGRKSFDYMNAIFVPEGTEVVAIHNGEDEIVIPPGYKLLARQVIDDVVINNHSYRRYVEWELLDAGRFGAQHWMDPRWT